MPGFSVKDNVSQESIDVKQLQRGSAFLITLKVFFTYIIITLNSRVPFNLVIPGLCVRLMMLLNCWQPVMFNL